MKKLQYAILFNILTNQQLVQIINPELKSEHILNWSSTLSKHYKLLAVFKIK